MGRLKINKLLVSYTLLIFLGGILAGGFWLTVNGYDVPWGPVRPAHAETTSFVSTSAIGDFFAADTIEKIVEQTGPAVVKIETVTKVQSRSVNPFGDDPFFRQFFGDDFLGEPETKESQGLGSGFIISKDGYILTNNHVIAGAEQVKVYLTSRQEPYEGKVVGTDAELDLAVVKIEAGSDLPILKLGDSNQTKVGNWVIAIGNPYGLDHTVTVGVISAKGRPVQTVDTEYKDLIQTDASINPGNSGGPLINLAGEVVGINTAINAEAQGIGFAIPSYTVQQVLDQLLETGKVIRPWLGVYIQPVTEELAKYFGMDKPDGALISSIQENSPAHKAGIKRGDVILEFNGKHISNPSDLQNAVQGSKIGDKVTVLVYRNKSVVTINVTIEEKK